MTHQIAPLCACCGHPVPLFSRPSPALVRAQARRRDKVSPRGTAAKEGRAGTRERYCALPLPRNY